jgi:surfeit locus 1 family protein
MIARWRAAGLFWPTLMTAVILPILLSLGTWQLQRKAWKEELLAQRASLGLKTPTDPGAALFSSQSDRLAEYTRVTLSGRYLHDRERFWFADGPEGSGFHVFTPFEVGEARVVWVNRGYIPARLRNPGARAAGQFASTTTLTGVIRYPGERNRFTPANDVAKNVWYWRDLPALQASAFPPSVHFAPVMIDLDATPAPPGGWPRGGSAQARISNRHLEYAFTWYALAATLIGVFCVFAYGRLTSAQK